MGAEVGLVVAVPEFGSGEEIGFVGEDESGGAEAFVEEVLDVRGVGVVVVAGRLQAPGLEALPEGFGFCGVGLDEH